MTTSEHADYTPTTDDVRALYVEQFNDRDRGADDWEVVRLEAEQAFDRWFAALASTPSPAQPTKASGCGVGGCVEAPHDVDVMHSWDDPE